MSKYEEWLKDQLHVDDGEDGYSELCGILHRIPFLPVNPMDWNRNDDGLNLGGEWAESCFESQEDILNAMVDLARGHEGGFCTMLELVIVLARYIQYELTDGPYEADICHWFEELIRNCGLEAYNNETIREDPERCGDQIEEAIGTVIFREYGWDGEGGFFPLQYPRSDQREEELLIQMNNYIAENYDIC